MLLKTVLEPTLEHAVARDFTYVGAAQAVDLARHTVPVKRLSRNFRLDLSQLHLTNKLYGI